MISKHRCKNRTNWKQIKRNYLSTFRIAPRWPRKPFFIINDLHTYLEGIQLVWTRICNILYKQRSRIPLRAQKGVWAQKVAKVTKIYPQLYQKNSRLPIIEKNKIYFIKFRFSIFFSEKLFLAKKPNAANIKCRLNRKNVLATMSSQTIFCSRLFLLAATFCALKVMHLKNYTVFEKHHTASK